MSPEGIKSEVEAFVADLGKRAANTFWQAASGTAATLWGGSQLNVHDLTSVDGLHKTVLVVGAGAIGAGASAVKTLLVGWVKGRRKQLVKAVEVALAPADPAPPVQRTPVKPGGVA
jgi:hypothetical protein